MAKMGDQENVNLIFATGIHKLLKLPNEKRDWLFILPQRLSLGEVLHRNARNIKNLDVITTGSDYRRGGHPP